MNGQLVSTRDSSRKEVSYSDALLQGLAPDGGLYWPVEFPQVSLEQLASWKSLPYSELAFLAKRPLVGDNIPARELAEQTRRAYSRDKFPIPDGNIVPIRPIGNGIFVQNLSLGPTAAFKDMALQQLAQEMGYELAKRKIKLVIAGATSGDTGSSAEDAFREIEDVIMFMFSPQIGMSAFQKAQMGLLSGKRTHNLSVDARFDPCQRIVKKLKEDPEFAHLGAVNSINWGRISSQVPYYISGYLQAASKIGEPVDFTVPSGNFGNVLAGYVARRMGLPIRNLIIATNENNVLERLIKTGVYQMNPAQITSSPSMDISEASNYERLAFELLGRDPDKLREYMEQFKRTGKVSLSDVGVAPWAFADQGFYAGSSTHADRISTIRKVHKEAKTIIDPHTADGVRVAQEYKRDKAPMVVMETALAVKFEDTIREALGFVPEREPRFRGLEDRVPRDAFYKVPNDIEIVKDYLRKHMN